jgi:hypothetical protein
VTPPLHRIPGADLLAAPFLEASDISPYRTPAPRVRSHDDRSDRRRRWRHLTRGPSGAPAGHFTSLRFQHCGGTRIRFSSAAGLAAATLRVAVRPRGRRIHALMPTGHRRGQALRTVPTRSFAEQCVESHTWPPALSYRTPPYDTKLQATRPREAGTGRQRRVPRLPADRNPHPAEPLHTGRLAADAARVVGG